ncbi:MAG: ATP-binding cassette domain-containing protein, partial [Pseudomonadota bacterium]
PFFLLLLILLNLLGGPVIMAPLLGVVLLLGLHGYAHMRSKSSIEAAAEFNRQQSNQLVETLVGMPSVKASGAAGPLMRSWERIGDDAGYEGHRARTWMNLATSGQLIITQLVVVLTLVIGAFQVSAGLMTVGALAASTLLVGRSLTPLTQTLSHAVRLFHLAPSADVIARLIDLEQEKGGEALSQRRRPLSGSVEFSAVSFTHEGAARPTLNDVSFKVQRGERIALIGRIGSGKSTLLKVMLRMLEAQKGAVLFDSSDARQLAPDHVRKAFAYMAQDSVLFDVSLREAITLGLGTVSDDEFKTAVSLSGVEAFASGLPKGYATPVGPGGSFLSGGERQAVSLARVLAMNPSALLLDEPTASMDNSLEAELITNLKSYIGGRTLIVATHRAALLSLVDRVIWLDKGRVLADGPRDEVLAKINGGASPAKGAASSSVAERREGGRRADDPVLNAEVKAQA